MQDSRKSFVFVSSELSAGSTRPASIGLDSQIFPTKRMTSDAKVFGDHHSASSHVLFVGDRLKMVRVTTRRRPTKMIKFKSFRDRSFQQFVNDSMRSAIRPSGLAITLSIEPSNPKPATAIRFRHDLSLEAFRKTEEHVR